MAGCLKPGRGSHAMLHVHRSERADGLLQALAEVLLEPPEDPFAPEVVAVPTRGMERWLSQRMSACLGATGGRQDGICANVEFPFPNRLVEDAVAVATGVAPDQDPWRPERAVWPLVEVVSACIDESWLHVLAAHLGHGKDEIRSTRRFAIVNHISGLFDRYGLYRPHMVQAWASGENLDAAGAPLPNDVLWQPELWQRLRRRIALPSPAERLTDASERLRSSPDLVDLPPRFSLFGLTRLPPARLQVLEALASGRDVHLFLLHPSPALWEAIASAPTPSRHVRREADPTINLANNRSPCFLGP